MQKLPDILRRAGVIALGTLAVSCGDSLSVPLSHGSVRSVVVSPSASTIPGGLTTTLSALVAADEGTATTVRWTSSNADVATVDASGAVTGSRTTTGTITITATSVVDPGKSGAAVVIVQPALIIPGFGLSPLSFAAMTDSALNPIQPGASVGGRINITVNVSGAGTIDIFLSAGSSCSSAAIAMTDLNAATMAHTLAMGPVTTLTVNTAAKDVAPAGPVFPNGPYCIKARLSSGNTVVFAEPLGITVNNP